MNNPVYEKLRSIAKKFPNAPGVYFWRNEKGEPIYIGRAGSLKKRIANYFTSKVDPRIREMTEAAHSLEFETTETLLEAIVLEANLIKQYWPKYNVQEKDNKSFIYLVVTNEEFPRLLFVRGRELQRYSPFAKGRGPLAVRDLNNEKNPSLLRSTPFSKGRKGTLAIFGPYQSYYLLRKALEIVRKIFPYSNCKPGQLKPCFHNQIGLCPGVCVGLVDAKTYHNNIRNIILFFRGDKKALIKKLQRDNPDAIKALKQVRDTALLADSDVLLRGNQLTDRRIEGYDISHSGGKNPVGAMVVFENGEADPSQYRLFNIRGLIPPLEKEVASTRVGGFKSLPATRYSLLKRENAQDDLAMLEEVIERRLGHAEWPLPHIFFVDGGANQVKRVNAVLKKHGHVLPVVGLSKAGKHAASAASGDKFVVANAKKTGKELILASRNLFQQVRNEAHRFSITAQRRRAKKSFLQ